MQNNFAEVRRRLLEKYQKSMIEQGGRSKTAGPSRPSANGDSSRSKSRSHSRAHKPEGRSAADVVIGKHAHHSHTTRNGDAPSVASATTRSKSAARAHSSSRSTSNLRHQSRQRLRPSAADVVTADSMVAALPRVDPARAAAFKERRSISAMRRAGSLSATAASTRPNGDSSVALATSIQGGAVAAPGGVDTARSTSRRSSRVHGGSDHRREHPTSSAAHESRVVDHGSESTLPSAYETNHPHRPRLSVARSESVVTDDVVSDFTAGSATRKRILTAVYEDYFAADRPMRWMRRPRGEDALVEAEPLSHVDQRDNIGDAAMYHFLQVWIMLTFYDVVVIVGPFRCADLLVPTFMSPHARPYCLDTSAVMRRECYRG